MQALGYMNLRGTGKGYKAAVLVLVQQGAHGRYIKLRKSGKAGVHFSDEEAYLNGAADDGDFIKILELLEGETIFL